MNKPKILYKYEPINGYSLRNLKNASLYFNAPVSFNDPFDCSLLKESQSYQDEDIVNLYNHYINEGILSGSSEATNISEVPPEFVGLVDNALKKTITEKHHDYLHSIGCTCFSETNKDILMWAHYTKGHRGICLEFDTSYDLFDKVFDISYSTDYPKINPVNLILNKSNTFDRNLLLPLLTKFICWGYEKEWRAFHEKPNTLYTYPVEALKAVYFGIAVERTDIEIICLILLGQSKDIKFYKGYKNKSKYKIDFSEFTYSPYKEKI